MVKYISTCLLLGWLTKINSQCFIPDDSTLSTCEKAITPTVQLLKMLEMLAIKTQKSFTIRTKVFGQDEIQGILKDGCTEVNSDGNACSFQGLLDNFKASISIRNALDEQLLPVVDERPHSIDISLDLKSARTIQESSRINDVCKTLISTIKMQTKPCQICPTPSKCNNVCSTTKTTEAETTKMPSSKPASPSYIDNSILRDKNADCFQASALVISGVISFIAGVFCTVIIAIVIRYVRTRKNGPKAAEDGGTVDFEQVNTTVVDRFKDTKQKGEMTYENLTGKGCNDNKAITEHVYLGVGTSFDSNTRPNILKREQIESEADFRGNSQHVSKETEYHVYNELEKKDNGKTNEDLNEDTNTESYCEHTYTGLANRETEDPLEIHVDAENSETKDHSNDPHYFIIHDENKENNARPYGRGLESEISIQTKDFRRDSDNDYFKLQKMEHSDYPIYEFKQNDDICVD